jgi:hypothetical protein
VSRRIGSSTVWPGVRQAGQDRDNAQHRS